MIEGLALSQDNYKQAVQLSMDRFGYTKSLIAVYMEDLRRRNPVESLNDVMQLRRMYDKLEVDIRNLKDLNVETCTYRSLFIAIISERIPL